MLDSSLGGLGLQLSSEAVAARSRTLMASRIVASPPASAIASALAHKLRFDTREVRSESVHAPMVKIAAWFVILGLLIRFRASTPTSPALARLTSLAVAGVAVAMAIYKPF